MRMFFKDSKKETGFIDNLKHRIPNMKYYEIKVGTTEILKGLLMQNEQDFANVVIDTNGKFIFYFPIYTESSEYIITPTSFGEAVDNIANEVSSEIKSTLFELATKDITEFNKSIEKINFSDPETIFYYYPYQNTMVIFVKKTELGELLESMETEEKLDQIVLKYGTKLQELIDAEKANANTLDELKKKFKETIIIDKDIVEYLYYYCDVDKIKGREIFERRITEKYFSTDAQNPFIRLAQEYNEPRNKYASIQDGERLFFRRNYPLFDDLWWNVIIPKRDEMNKKLRSELRYKLIPVITNDTEFKKCTNERLRRDYMKNLFESLDSSYDCLTANYKHTGKISSDDLIIANKIWKEIK